MPAQVPKMGLPAAAKSSNGVQKSQESMSLISVVLSPPGKIRPSTVDNCVRFFDHAGFDGQGVEHFAVGRVVALQSQNSNHCLYLDNPRRKYPQMNADEHR